MSHAHLLGDVGASGVLLLENTTRFGIGRFGACQGNDHIELGAAAEHVAHAAQHPVDFSESSEPVEVHCRCIRCLKKQFFVFHCTTPVSRTGHVQSENAKAVEFIPDLADKDKAEKLTLRVARELLPDLGFKESELAALANGKERLSIYDHRIQRLFADSLKLRDIQNAPKAVVKPDLPPVQRPGVARAPGADKAALVQSLTDKLSNSGSEKDALELLIARRASRRAS